MKFGDQLDKDFGFMTAVLGEEYGEVCHGINEAGDMRVQAKTHAEGIFDELVQVAAVALKMLEQLEYHKQSDRRLDYLLGRKQ